MAVPSNLACPPRAPQQPFNGPLPSSTLHWQRPQQYPRVSNSWPGVLPHGHGCPPSHHPGPYPHNAAPIPSYPGPFPHYPCPVPCVPQTHAYWHPNLGRGFGHFNGPHNGTYQGPPYAHQANMFGGPCECYPFISYKNFAYDVPIQGLATPRYRTAPFRMF